MIGSSFFTTIPLSPSPLPPPAAVDNKEKLFSSVVVDVPSLGNPAYSNEISIFTAASTANAVAEQTLGVKICRSLVAMASPSGSILTPPVATTSNRKHPSYNAPSGLKFFAGSIYIAHSGIAGETKSSSERAPA
ncbi:unnamed protein product [Linum trigynum]|uniref:Uncharacterized protein n=1 Tax=Linum trigynum TaxID=586398 RepID=A0AAV2GK90_9ROSI